MDIQLKIDNPDVIALATELATLTGTSVEEAVAKALRKSVERERLVQQRTAEILAAAAEFRGHLLPPLPTSDHGWIYGDDGLPA
jgi:hypothetical protein